MSQARLHRVDVLLLRVARVGRIVLGGGVLRVELRLLVSERVRIGGRVVRGLAGQSVEIRPGWFSSALLTLS